MSDTTLDRGARRRARTRAKLIEAARVLFARQGVEATRINEITEEADVGFGSFYNHFEGKDAVLKAVLEETVAAQGAAIETLTADLEDPAEVVAVAHRHFVDLATADPTWAWLLVRLEMTQDVMLLAVGPYARRDLKRGLDAGRFAVADPDLVLDQSGGALLAVMRSVLTGRAGKRAAERHAEGVLRLFGLDRDDAAAVAKRAARRSR